MANRVFQPLFSAGYGRVLLSGAWYPNGTSGPTLASGAPVAGHAGFTIARTGVGTFTLTLPDKYAAVLDVNFNLILQTPSGLRGVVVSIPRPQAQFPNTFVCKVVDGTGTPTDVPQLLPSAGAANTGNLCTFSAFMKNSTIGVGQ